MGGLDGERKKEPDEIAGFRCFPYVYLNVNVTKSLHYT